MTIEEKITAVINDYVITNGTSSIMDKDQLFAMVSKVYKINKDSFLPADFCYNRTNEGIDFERHTHLFERRDDGRYLVLGDNYPYSGHVYYKRKGESEDSIWGIWTNGLCKKEKEIENNIELRLKDLLESVKKINTISIDVFVNENVISIYFQENLVCNVSVEDKVYKIFNLTNEWIQKTSYYCDSAPDGTWFYYLETIDECIGEVNRLLMFESKKDKKRLNEKGESASELSKIVTADAFQQSYTKFIEQADKNKTTKRSHGSKTPYGFTSMPKCQGKDFMQHFGQGAASATPYLNWWVVSIYYITSSGKVVMGIEKERYSHLKDIQIKTLGYKMIGNKTSSVAVFYEKEKDNVNCRELYEIFIAVCEEVMRLGLD